MSQSICASLHSDDHCNGVTFGGLITPCIQSCINSCLCSECHTVVQYTVNCHINNKYVQLIIVCKLDFIEGLFLEHEKLCLHDVALVHSALLN